MGRIEDIKDLRMGNIFYFCDEKDLRICTSSFREYPDGTIQVLARNVVPSNIGKDYYISSFEDEDHINPLPITDDILMRLGFEPMYEIDRAKIGFMFYLSPELRFEYDEYSHDISICRVIDSMYCDIKIPKKIEYVHQLQNLFYNLTGKELVLVN